MTQLFEGSNNPLISPELTGTDEEIMNGFTYWNTLVTTVRQMLSVNTGYQNKEAIISHLEREVSLLRTELTNVSAIPAANRLPGVTHMKQPLQAPDPAQQADIAAGKEVPPNEKVVDLSKANEEIEHEVDPKVLEALRRAAGIKRIENKLDRAIKNFAPLPLTEIEVVHIPDPTPETIEMIRAMNRKLAGLPKDQR